MFSNCEQMLNTVGQMAINIVSRKILTKYITMTHVMQLLHGLVTAVGGKGEIEVAALQMGSSLLPTSSEECDQKSFSLKGPLLTIRHVSDG